MLSKRLLYLTIAIAAATVIAEAKRVVLRPLTADQVYNVLKAAGREDAVPEGRVVTQGIAALTGFGLGIAKGVGGSILFDVVTSNETIQWLSNLNLASLASSATKGTVTAKAQIPQEICFGTKGRSLESDVQAEGREATTTTTTTPTQTTDGATSGGVTGGSFTTSEPTYSYSSPTTTTGSGTVTGDAGDSTNTQTGITTNTGTGEGQTCLVVQ